MTPPKNNTGKNPKLTQIVAIEKSVKSRVQGTITQSYKSSQKPDLFNGFSKTYRRKDEDGEDFPPEHKKVQIKADELIQTITKSLTELYDVTATKDYANCLAFADVEVDGQVLVEKAPIPFLLFLEKQITDFRTFVSSIPVLDTSEDWILDLNSGFYKTPSIATHRTKKLQKPIVLYEATKEHPAQTQLISEDIVIGYWDTVKQSGALPIPKKQELLDRIEKLLNAIKFAREQANAQEAERKKVAEKLFGYLLNGRS